MNYSRSRSTEECPLTKDSTYKYKWSSFCGDGLKFIISCFTVLTVAITATLILQLLYTDNAPQDRTGLHGAVASDYTNCSQIGTKIMRKGGNAVDAAIAATVCMTVVAPHKTGLGGGGCAMIYNHREQLTPIIIDFANNTIEGTFSINGIRIPAVVKGLEVAHKLRGKLSWQEILKPSILLAKEGFVVSKELASEVAKNTALETVYGHLSPGDVLKLPELADTLAQLSQHGSNALYNGTISIKILHSDVNFLNQLHELASYTPEVYEAENTVFYGHTVYYPPYAASLPVTMKALEDLKLFTENASLIETQIAVAQALIHSVSTPLHLLQNSEEERYTGVMGMDWEDTYVCILTGLSTPLGSGYMTSAGFVLDKTGDNNNFRSFTSVIFHKRKGLCGLRGVLGTDDVFLTGQLLYDIIVRESNISTAIEYPRYYFLSDGLAIENDQKHSVDPLIRSQLTSIITPSQIDINSVMKSVNAIIKKKDSMMSHSDSRGGGLASRF